MRSLFVITLVLAGVAQAATAYPIKRGYMTFDLDRGAVLGVYYPEDYSKAELNRMLRAICIGGAMESYAEFGSPDGHIPFSIICSNGVDLEDMTRWEAWMDDAGQVKLRPWKRFGTNRKP